MPACWKGETERHPDGTGSDSTEALHYLGEHGRANPWADAWGDS
jgi:hypothetical protein